jgi:PAS domain S-box-containing protein
MTKDASPDTTASELADRASRELEASEERYRLLFEASPLPMWVFDVDTLAFLAVNGAALRHYGYTREEFAKMTLSDIRPEEDLHALKEHVGALPPIDEGSAWRHRKKDGSVIYVDIKAHDLLFEGRRARLILSNDVTSRHKAEEARAQAEAALARTEAQLRHSQKLEAVGRLAGGVAHDFNNLLSVILSYSALILADLAPEDPMRGEVAEIEAAGKRAAELTRQLLAFGRRQMLQPRVVDPAQIVTGMERMLRRLIGEDVDLTLHRDPGAGSVKVDPGQLEQVVMNLVVNARDAMPRGGRLTIETANVELDERYAAEHVGVVPGPYVVLSVTDTGTGMDEATQARIFEPYFTTKEVGKGSGLGLSMVFGIVQQSGGNIWVYSEPERGTTFRIYLPRAEEALSASLAPAPPPVLRGTETVLLVEDDERVRNAVRTSLERYGYEVLVARDDRHAAQIAQERRRPIHVLLTDVIMPRVSGPELAEKLTATRPEMKVVYMSGYTNQAIIQHGTLGAEIDFVQKPVIPAALARKVREVLDREGGSPG